MKDRKCIAELGDFFATWTLRNEPDENFINFFQLPMAGFQSSTCRDNSNPFLQSNGTRSCLVRIWQGI